MEVTLSGPSEVTITGEIKAIGDYLEIKKVIERMREDDISSITVKIPTSSSISSALIGFFLRLIHENKIKLTVYAGNEKLINMLEVLNLMNIFNVKRL